MKLSRLTLRAFGLFSGYTIDFDDERGLHVIYGLNEAGKTTVLRALTDFLYGIPHITRDAYRHEPARLRIEARLRCGDGKEMTLIRRKGRNNTLLDPDNKPVADAVLRQFLGDIDRNWFSKMFGMNHRSLRAGGESILEGGGAVGEALFEAAAGISGLRNVLRELDEEAREFFKPGGSAPRINASIRRYKEARERVAELALVPRDWAERERAYLEGQKELQDLSLKLRGLRKQKARLARLQITLPLLARRRELLAERTKLGEVPDLPESFTEERTALVRERENADYDAKKAQMDIQGLEEKASRIEIPQGLLDHADDIGELLERLDNYRTYAREIPAAQGETKRLALDATVVLRQINPALSALEEAESLRLRLICVEEIRKLINDRPLLEQKLGAARDRVSELEDEQRENKEEKEKLGVWLDDAELSNAVAHAQSAGDLENALGNKRADGNLLEERLEKGLQSLGLWSGSLAELERLPLPFAETVRQFEKEFARLVGERNAIEDKIGEEQGGLAGGEQQLSALEAGGAVPTEEQLAQARQRRQRGWHLVRRAWLEGVHDPDEEKAFDPDRALSDAYERTVDTTDELADRLRRDAGRVERKALLLNEMENRRRRITELDEVKKHAEETQQILEERWREVWRETGIVPLSPEEMLSWLTRCQELRAEAAELARAREEERNLAKEIAAHRQEVSAALERLGEPGAASGETLRSMVGRARRIAEHVRRTAVKLEENKKNCDRIATQLVRARNGESTVLEVLVGWEQEWLAALREAGLPDDTGPEAAAVYLDRLDELLHKLDTLKLARTSLEQMKQYQEDFEARLLGLVAELAPDLVGMPSDQAASELRGRAARAAREQAVLAELREQVEKGREKLRDAKAVIEETDRGLERLRKLAGCADVAGMEEVEKRTRLALELNGTIKELEEQLVRSGSGLSLEALEQEAEGVDIDALPADLTEAEGKLQARDEEFAQKNQEFGATKKGYEENCEGRSTAVVDAAEEAQGVLAEMRADTEQCLRLRLAALVLRKGIDRYRDEHQNPVIRRAGTIFSTLTLGSFSALLVDFDESDNPVLVGLRPTGERVKVEGMSDGTQDQLYLALRLASLERYLEQNAPIPLILDDILVNFDDRRAGETLKVLAALSKKTQIIFFSHHKSLVELAQHAVPQEMLAVYELRP